MKSSVILFIILGLSLKVAGSQSMKATSYLNEDYSQNDVVINEIMADPTPTVALPSWEYIELYNVSGNDINLKDWLLTIGSTKCLFKENIVFQADEYLILCHDDAVEEMSRYGRCQGFSSFKITNSGCEIALFDDDETYISQIEFELSWHSDDYKEEGGWSLEQIDVQNPCAGKRNWGSSVCGAGGTPGTKNSISRENIIKPMVDYLCLLADNIIEIHYDQMMNPENLLDIKNYTIIETQSNPAETHISSNDNCSVELVFNHHFDEDRLYTLEIDNILNCKDIPGEEKTRITFGISKTTETKDVVINEILFHPIDGCVEYIEIYNRSDKVIDISNMMVGTIKQTFPNPADTTMKEICSEQRSLLPHSYLLLSIDGDVVRQHYNSKSKCFLDIASLPALPNEEGRVVICDKSRMIIDEVYYSDKMHYDLLAETQGVSLERISTEKSSSDEDNWHSAAYDVNYGTPGYKNSMAFEINQDTEEKTINIIPEVVSPDGDGHNDNCGIYCNLDKEGYSINIKIFDTEGNMIRDLLRNSLVGQTTCIFWDGCDDNKHVVMPGIYIVMTEIFDLNGNLKRLKNVVAVNN